MASPNVRSFSLGALALVLLIAGVYLIDPTFFGLMPSYSGFANPTMGSDSNSSQNAGQNEVTGPSQAASVLMNPLSAGGDMVSGSKPKKAQDASGAEGFADVQDVTGPAAFDSAANPAGCYPRDQLTPGELLPKDPNSVWAQQNPMGTGSLKGKNFLSAGALIGVNTVGQSLRNANHQLRSEPPNPQVPVSVFNTSTIEPDTNRRDLEVN
jgi:hypothetical protein